MSVCFHSSCHGMLRQSMLLNKQLWDSKTLWKVVVLYINLMLPRLMMVYWDGHSSVPLLHLIDVELRWVRHDGDERDFEYILCPAIPFYIRSHSISHHEQPWRFIKLGKETVAKVVQLREDMNNQKRGNSKEDNGKIVSGADGSFVSWTKVPHWIGEWLWYIFDIDNFVLYQINHNINTLDINKHMGSGYLHKSPSQQRTRWENATKRRFQVDVLCSTELPTLNVEWGYWY